MRTSQHLGAVPNEQQTLATLEVPADVLRLDSSAVRSFVSAKLDPAAGGTVAGMVGAYIGRFETRY